MYRILDRKTGALVATVPTGYAVGDKLAQLTGARLRSDQCMVHIAVRDKLEAALARGRAFIRYSHYRVEW